MLQTDVSNFIPKQQKDYAGHVVRMPTECLSIPELQYTNCLSSCVLIANFNHTQYNIQPAHLVFLLITLNMQLPAGLWHLSKFFKL